MSEIRGNVESTITRDGTEGVTNGATEVTVAAAPSAGVRRKVTFFHTRNTTGATKDVTLRHKKGATTRDLFFVSKLGKDSMWDPIAVNGSVMLNDTDESLVVFLDAAGAMPWSATWEDEE
jgi:hypothetical protein